MATEVVFGANSMIVDNEQGRAAGWLPGQHPIQGQALARQLGRRHEDDGITAVFSSGLARAAQTGAIAFGQSAIPVLHDWRLRGCDYWSRNGIPASERPDPDRLSEWLAEYSLGELREKNLLGGRPRPEAADGASPPYPLEARGPLP